MGFDVKKERKKETWRPYVIWGNLYMYVWCGLHLTPKFRNTYWDIWRKIKTLIWNSNLSLSQFHLLLYIEITPIIFIIISFCKFSCNKICNSFNNFLWEKSLSTKRPIFSHLSLCFCVVVGMDNHYLKCFKVVSLALENNKN